ncbi:FkbM family methyltransferase [Chthonobacter albigriseus]|uniref:FkbM family methyltransferase n=1 Tax=Chthonobacter albigriseus TaxID=1683161 RepID=UPI0015EF32A0|nr:FkbM family methyltransferase [Chthonobacter albigriseus]
MARRRSQAAVGGTPVGIATTHFGPVRFDVDLGLHPMSRKFYYRTHDMDLERIYRRHLHHGGIFVDVGAGLGYWSALAASLVGPNGQVHAFEPVPQFYASVRRLVAANPTYHIKAQNAALGSAPTVLPMTMVLPTAPAEGRIAGASLVPGFFAGDPRPKETADVHVGAFDDYADWARIDLDRVGLIRIDSGGFEAEVLNGMTSVLLKRQRRVPILATLHTDPARHRLLDGRALVKAMDNFAYLALEAHSLKRIRTEDLRPRETILFIPIPG